MVPLPATARDRPAPPRDRPGLSRDRQMRSGYPEMRPRNPEMHAALKARPPALAVSGASSMRRGLAVFGSRRFTSGYLLSRRFAAKTRRFAAKIRR